MSGENMNIDDEIAKTEEKIDKLKILKIKQEEMKRLQDELGVTEVVSPVKTESKKKHRLPKVSITPRSRKVIASMMVFCMISIAVVVLVNRVEAANPIVVYTSPADSGLFADTNNGDGVSWVINVSDADTDIAEVELWGNSSGTWAVFYDSGALGGVAYYNTSGQNENWTGSWTKYWWNISANDGAWTNVTYSFTTGYQWGGPQMAVLEDGLTLDNAVILKNDTGDYYLFYEDGAIDVKTSNTGTNWSLQPKSADIGAGARLTSCFTYNNSPYLLYFVSNNLRYGYWDGASWQTASTDILQYKSTTTACSSFYADCIYYDGLWNIIGGYASTPPTVYLRHYTGIFPNSWTSIANLDAGTQYITGGNSYFSQWYSSLAVLDGVLHLVYKDDGCDLYWQTYDGASWTDKGDIGGDSLDLGGGTTSAYQYYGCSMVKDPVNDQVVTVYINNSGDLMYRVTDNTTSWSDPYLIFSKGAYDIRYPHGEFMDSRLVVSFSYNLRGNYNIYTISSPDYSGGTTGLNYTLNRIQWPDAAPGDTNVNSTIFSLKNLNNRDIKTITWHMEDLGEITANSNFEMWTNMSGSWASIGVCDASGNITTLDISGEIAGGGEWEPGGTLWWKLEILAVGAVSEDIHTTDEDIYYRITF